MIVLLDRPLGGGQRTFSSISFGKGMGVEDCESMSTESTEKSRARLFYERYKWPLLVVVALLVSQSFTISLPIDGRIVNESGNPISDAEIAALWHVETVDFIHVPTPAGAVRIAHVKSGPQGRFRVPAAFIAHTPMLPFSLLSRTNHMPQLLVVARGYRLTAATNDRFYLSGAPKGGGFWFVRTSSVDESDIELQSLQDFVSEDGSLVNANFYYADSTIALARSSCRRRLTCTSASLYSFLELVRQGERELEELLKQKRRKSQ